MLLLPGKTGGKVYESLYLSGGTMLFLLPLVPVVVGLPFGAVTGGNSDYHVTFSFSAPFIVVDDEFSIGDGYWFSFCGNARVSEHTVLMLENWFFALPGEDDMYTEIVLSLAIRFMSERFSGTVGLFFKSQIFDAVSVGWLFVS